MQRRAQGAAHALEAGLNHVVGIFSTHGQVQYVAEDITQGAEKVLQQLGWQRDHLCAANLPLKGEIGAARQIDGDLRFRLIHRQQEAIAADACLVAKGLTQGLAQGQGAVLDGVMLIDPQVALAVQLQAKSTVPGELLEHVIEEANAGVDANGAVAVEFHARVDGGFAGAPPDPCAAREQRARDVRPALTGRRRMPHPHTFYSEPGGELQITVAISDHRAARDIDSVIAQPVAQQARLRLAAIAGVRDLVRTDENRLEADALGGKGSQNEFLAALEVSAGKGCGAEAILVAHHDKAVPRIPQRSQCDKNSRQEADLLQCINLLVGGLFHERAVAIDKECRRGIVRRDAHDRLASNRSFCSGVPTLIRRDWPSVSARRRSRSSRPTARARARAAPASSKSTSRKFASLGQTRLTPGNPASAAASRSRSRINAPMRSRTTSRYSGCSARSTTSMVI